MMLEKNRPQQNREERKCFSFMRTVLPEVRPDWYRSSASILPAAGRVSPPTCAESRAGADPLQFGLQYFFLEMASIVEAGSRGDSMRAYLNVKWLLFVLIASCAAQSQSAVGIFENHSDVGTVFHPGAVDYDSAKQTYTITGSGENMWSVADAFQFAWKKMSGDVSLTAEISFLTKTGNEHKKAALMLRQSLDADSVYVDVALHLSGLTALQFRDEKGAVTREVQSNLSAPKRLRIAKRGEYVYMSLAADGGDPKVAG